MEHDSKNTMYLARETYVRGKNILTKLDIHM